MSTTELKTMVLEFPFNTNTHEVRTKLESLRVTQYGACVVETPGEPVKTVVYLREDASPLDIEKTKSAVLSSVVGA